MTPSEHLTAGLATAWDCTTEEAETRIAAKRKRASRDTGREDIPWTAARCNRLLRSITSRINILRRQSKLCAAPTTQKSSKNCQRRAEEGSPVPALRTCGKSPAKDPDWVPGAKLNASTRTYSNGSKSQNAPCSRKPDSGFSTPFVKRLLTSEKFSAPRRRQQDFFGDHGGNKTRRSLQLPVQLASGNEEAQKNLVSAFSSVLATTSESSPPTRVGARSLMSACLRRVPDYIDLETNEICQDDVDTEDVTSSVYSDLESLGTNSSGGWSGLRETVRAHCIQHICATIGDGLIHGTRIAELVNTCSRGGAVAEAELLLASWLGQSRQKASHRLSESHPALSKLDDLRLTHDATEVYLRRHSALVRQNLVWVNDILRSGSLPLKDLIKALVRGSGQDEAMAFLENAVLVDVQKEGSSTLPIFSRLAGLLAAIALTQSGGAGSSNGLALSSVIHRIASSVAQLEISESVVGAVKGRGITMHPFLMASTLLQFASLPIETPYTFIELPTSTIFKHQQAFAKFACGVTHHVFRFSDANEMESLLLTTSGFLNSSIDCSSNEREHLSRLAFEIAFSYAEQTGVAVDHRFAEKVIAGKNKGEGVTETPRRRAQVSGFKWEEGLCEWVAATPLPTTLSDKTRPNNCHDSPKRAFTVKQDRYQQEPEKATLAIPSSPDAITAGPQPLPSRPSVATSKAPRSPVILKERSSNAMPAKQVESHAEKPKKRASFVEGPAKAKRNSRASSFLPPVEGKQVHLKLEKEKRRAASLAQKAAKLPETHAKRSHSLAEQGESGCQRRALLEDTDELGIPTPARKKVKFAPSFAPTRQPSRISLPARVLDVDAMSDDELGL